jgi:hypothetical protein
MAGLVFSDLSVATCLGQGQGSSNGTHSSWPLGLAFTSESRERASDIVVTAEILAVDLTAFDMCENKLLTIPAPWEITNLADAQENSRIFLITSK